MIAFDGYQCEGFFDEMFDAHGQVRPEAKLLVDLVQSLPEGELESRKAAIERAMYRLGVTFTAVSYTHLTLPTTPYV